jgi:aminoglycoside 3-N-acetyltransferase
MLKSALMQLLDDRQKRTLKAKVTQAKQRVIRTFYSYDTTQMKSALWKTGIRTTDTVLVHSNFEPLSGFRGSPADMVAALVDLVPEGNLLMVSIPFRGSAYDYLAQGKTFDVRKTLSMMGLVTEMFRRRPGTLRSLHPTHPILACGKDAPWIVSGHEECLHPCGVGSPFDKLRQLDGKILFYDVGFAAITFFHYVEDALKSKLPFRVYADRLFEANVIDAEGQRRTIRTYAYSRETPRDPNRLEAEMRRAGRIRAGRVGNSRFQLVSAAEVGSSMEAMVTRGDYPYHIQRAET